jgi:succinyl-CoA synthetase beta subunit
MKGGNERAGRKILLESGLALLVANNMDDAAEKAVNVTKEG